MCLESGPVSHITAKVDEHAPEPGVWIISWRYPLHPRGRIFKYKYDITANGRVSLISLDVSFSCLQNIFTFNFIII